MGALAAEQTDLRHSERLLSHRVCGSGVQEKLGGALVSRVPPRLAVRPAGPPGSARRVSLCTHSAGVGGIRLPEARLWSAASPRSRPGGSGLSSWAAPGRAGGEGGGEGVPPAASPS